MYSFNIDYKKVRTELCEIGLKYDCESTPKRLDSSEKRDSQSFTIFYNSIFSKIKLNRLNIAILFNSNLNQILMWNEYFPNSIIHGFVLNDVSSDVSSDVSNDVSNNNQYINYYSNIIQDKERIKLFKINISNKNNIIDTFNNNNLLYDIIIDSSTNFINDQIRIIKSTNQFLKSGGIFIIENIFKYYIENDYIDKLSEILNDFKEYYFLTFNHEGKTIGNNNNKLFYLIKNGNSIFDLYKKITIITPSIRPNNLLKIKNSINFNYVNEWIIVYDGSKIKDNPLLFKDNDKIKEYLYKGEGISGNPQRNYALDNIVIKDTYLYFLDDDNEIHPDLYKLLTIIDNNKLYTFNQKDRINGDYIEIYNIDTAMLLIDYNLCKDIRWILEKYNADGYYIKECYLKNLDKWIYINNTLSTYNIL